MRVNIAVALKHIHDLDGFICITEENHITLEGKAADIDPELWSGPSKCSR